MGVLFKKRSTKYHMSSHDWIKEDSIIFSFLPKTQQPSPIPPFLLSFPPSFMPPLISPSFLSFLSFFSPPSPFSTPTHALTAKWERERGREREREREREGAIAVWKKRREERKKKWVFGKLRPVGINCSDQQAFVVRLS